MFRKGKEVYVCVCVCVCVSYTSTRFRAISKLKRVMTFKF